MATIPVLLIVSIIRTIAFIAKKNSNFISKFNVKMYGSTSVGTVAKFVRNFHIGLTSNLTDIVK